MLKYTETEVVFEEVPNEITLAINISGCPCRCPLCHSKYLWGDIGQELDESALERLIEANKGITCVSFMGGDNEPSEVNRLAKYISNNIDVSLKICWYSGRDELSKEIDIENFDYIKIGRYDGDFGSLDKETTNQKFYVNGRVLGGDAKDNVLYNITDKFWKRW